jgi:hypothetical protein
VCASPVNYNQTGKARVILASELEGGNEAALDANQLGRVNAATIKSHASIAKSFVCLDGCNLA